MDFTLDFPPPLLLFRLFFDFSLVHQEHPSVNKINTFFIPWESVALFDATQSHHREQSSIQSEGTQFRKI